MEARIQEQVALCRKEAESGRPRAREWRVKQLNALKRMVTENEAELRAAMAKDLRSISILEDYEVRSGQLDADHMLSNLDEYMKPRSRSVPLSVQPGRGAVHLEPYGLVLVMASWNYPLSLLLKPLAGALAAGNTVVLKPSEVSAACSAAIGRLVPLYFDAGAVTVFEGGPEVATLLLKQRWDYIMYTGNGTVGKIVHRAAAEHLTPTTLELGGKSPVYVDASANLDVAARRLTWGKFVMNNGQTCVAPDYILVHHSVAAALEAKILQCIATFFRNNPRESKDYSRIINERHVARLAALLPGCEIVTGGDYDAATHYFAPTLVRNPPLDSPIMKEEIFGPILPLLSVASVAEAVQIIRARPKPLALYVFSEASSVTRSVLDQTSSGGAAVNDVVVHITCPDLPFGGVGESGMGAYNGVHTFDLFSHKRSVLSRPSALDSSIRYPPYSPLTTKILILFMKFNLNLASLKSCAFLATATLLFAWTRGDLPHIPNLPVERYLTKYPALSPWIQALIPALFLWIAFRPKAKRL